ncbi:hypothetical protein SKDZ_13G3080 [Saccharomyces kudriavzevii ZP591]|nr:hypothetical protein SKDZ_13G3080 [Saccharomyces kudriavzevii ZP591]
MRGKQPKRTKENASVKRNYRCVGYPDCNMSFNRAEHLARHIRKHTGEKPFQCNICLKFFSRIDNLRQHQSSVHSDVDLMSLRRQKQSSGNTANGPNAGRRMFPQLRPYGIVVQPAPLPYNLPIATPASAQNAISLYTSPYFPHPMSSAPISLPHQPPPRPHPLPIYNYMQPLFLNQPPIQNRNIVELSPDSNDTFASPSKVQSFDQTKDAPPNAKK